VAPLYREIKAQGYRGAAPRRVRPCVHGKTNRLSQMDRSIDHDQLLTPEQIRAIIAATAANPLHHALLKFLYLTGARISEVLGLRWRDLRQFGEGGEAHILGKGGKRRTVYLSAEL
jgi:integrase/recombinase XerD